MAKKTTEKKGIRKFGWARAFVVFWLGILGLGYLHNMTFLGILFLLAMFYMIFMDAINERLFDRKAKAETESIPVYDPSELGDPIKCPFCGKKIPSKIKYCYYCGRSIETVRQIEAIRTQSLEQIDQAASGLEDGQYKDNVLAIRKLTDKILRKYEEKTEHHNDYDKFVEYYLPKTIAAIKHYQVLSTLSGLDGEEAKIKTQLEESLGMLEEAFENILNRVSTEGLYDTSADVSVLETILQQDGLTDPEFKA